MTNRAIFQELEAASLLVDHGNYDEAGPALRTVFDKILERNYFPLLERVLFLKRSVDKNTDNDDQLLVDSLLLTSPYLRSNCADLRVNELYAYTENAEEGKVIEFPKEYAKLLPFKCSVKYHPEQVVCGSVSQVVIDFSSFFENSFLLNDLSVWFTKSDGTTDVASLGEFQLHEKASTRLNLQRSLPLKVDWEKVSFVSYKVNQVMFKVEYQEESLLRARLDESICQIAIQQDVLAVTWAKTPVTVTVTAAKEKLTNVKIRLTPSDGTMKDCDVLCGDIKRGEEKVLGDVELGDSLTVDMLVFSKSPRRSIVGFDIEFDAETSGHGEIHKEFEVTFLLPFSVAVSLYDQNMQVITIKTKNVNGKSERMVPEILNSDFVYAETSITNLLPIPITLRGVKATFEPLTTKDLPMDLETGEQYRFMGQIKKEGQHGLEIRYAFDKQPKCSFRCMFGKIKVLKRDFKAFLEYPSIVQKNTPFDVTLHVVNLTDWSRTLTVEAEFLNKFMVEGPKNRSIPLLGREDRSVTFRMVSFITGSTILPQISVSSHENDTKNTVVLKSPIVITY